MVTLRGNALRFLISLRTYFISVELVKNFSASASLSSRLRLIFTKKRFRAELGFYSFDIVANPKRKVY